MRKASSMERKALCQLEQCVSVEGVQAFKTASDLGSATLYLISWS